MVMRRERRTAQYDALVALVKEFSGFFDAKELLAKAKQKGISAGQATIYRFLDDARIEGVVHCFNCDGRLIYSRTKKQHSHFICEMCKKQFHIDVKPSLRGASLPGKVCHAQVDVYGVCDGCVAD